VIIGNEKRDFFLRRVNIPLAITSPIRTALRLNACSCGERLAINRLRQDKAFVMGPATQD
jgi:hypothetical protein